MTYPADRFITTDGVRLAYALDDFAVPWKSAPHLVLLHSAMGCMDRFFAWMPDLVSRFRVVRLPHNVWDSMPERCGSDVLAFIEARTGAT